MSTFRGVTLRKGALCAVAGAMILATAACGTRVRDEAAGSPSGFSAQPVQSGLGGGDGTSVAAAPADSSVVSSGSDAPSAAAGAVPAQAPRGAGAAGNAAGTPTTTKSTNQTAPSGGRPAGAGAGAAPAPGSVPPGVAPPTPGASSGRREPIVVASVGTYSGPAANSLKGLVDGAQLWVKSVNARGGVNGHEIQLSIYDDAGDPARHKAQVQQAVEQRKVHAFLANAEALTGDGSKDYIAAQRVPVIGTEGAWDWIYSNPMYFQQISAGDTYYRTGVAANAKEWLPAVNKIGVLACVEAQACGDVIRAYKERGQSFGFELVYNGRASIAQPDYTAECLAARNAGVQGFVVMLDGAALQRLAAACTRQGYKPKYSTLSSIVLDRHKKDPNLDGMIAESRSFPYFQSNTPATEEFQRAVKTFSPGLNFGASVADGWVAGKLLEKAAAALPQQPTREALLKGLWSIKGDDLGGITYPLTFAEGKTSVRMACWFPMKIQDGNWVSGNGFKLECRNDV